MGTIVATVIAIAAPHAAIPARMQISKLESGNRP